MRKLFVLITLLGIFDVFGGVPPFGQQYLDFVRGSARQQSTNIATENFKLRHENFHYIMYMEAYTKMHEIDSLLQIFEDSVDVQQKRLALIEDEDERNYLRNFYSHQNQNLIFRAEVLVSEFKLNLKNIDSLGSRAEFYNNALYNIGSALVMESYTQIGNNFSEYLPEKYPFSFKVTYTMDEDGNFQSVNSDEPGAAQYGSIAGIIIGSLVADGLGGAIGGAIGGLIGSAIDFFNGKKKEREAQKEYNRQMNLVREANRLLQKELLQPEEQYAIYRELDSTYKVNYLPVRQTLDSQFLLVDQAFQELSVINLTNKRAARSYLTKERLVNLRARYASGELRDELYGYSSSVRFLQTLSKDYTFLRAKVNAASRSKELFDLESLHDALRTNRSLLLVALDATTYPLIEEDVRQFAGRYEALQLRLEDELLAHQEVKDGQTMWAMASLKKKQRKQLQLKALAQLAFIGAPEMTLKWNEFDDWDGRSRYGLPRVGPDMTIVYRYDPYYSGQVANGGANPMRDVMASSYDGGMSDFNIRAANEINAARRDMQARVTRMQNRFAEIQPANTQWRGAIVDHHREPIVPPSRIGDITQGRQRIQREQRDILGQYQAVLNQMISTEYTDVNYIIKQKQLDLLSQVINDNPDRSLSAVNTPLMRGYGRVVSKEEVILGKLGHDIKEAEKLVQAGTHPTIGSMAEMSSLVLQSEQLSTFVESLKSSGYPQEVIDHYLDELNDVRLRFKGFSTDTNTENVIDNSGTGAVFDQSITRLASCISNRGLDACSYQHELFVNRVTDNNSDDGMSYMGTFSDENIAFRVSSVSVSGDNLFVFNGNDSTEQYAIVLPGYYRDPDDTRLIFVDLVDPSQSQFNVRLEDIYPDPSGLAFYRRSQNEFFGNLSFSSVDSEFNAAKCYDLDIGYYDCGEVSTSFDHQNSDGDPVTTRDDIDLGTNYVMDVRGRYGSNADIIFTDLHVNLELYFSVSSIPVELRTDEYNQLVDEVFAFDQSYDVLVDPSNLYKSQALRGLVNLTNQAILEGDNQEEIDAIIQEALQYKELILDLTTGMTPGVNDARDLYEFLTGVDVITQEDIGILGRVLAGGGLIMGSGVLFRKLLQSDAANLTTRILAQAQDLRGFPGMKYITDGPLKGSMISEKGIIYKKMRQYGDGESHTILHIMSRHHEWGRTRISRSDYRRSSRYYAPSPKDIMRVNDEAFEILKANKPGTVTRFTPNNPNARGYEVRMNDAIGYTRSGSPYNCLRMIFDTTTDYDALITSFPVKCK